MGLKLIVGLGNPGPKYARNRHNVGFRLVDRLAQAHGLAFARQQFRALVAGGSAAGQRVLLAKPLTFMNLSGNAVGALVRFYKLLPQDLLVAYDDLDLPVGKIRLRSQGGSGGHKGMKSIIERLATEEFARLRIGIGRPTVGDPIDYVLQDFAEDEAAQVIEALDQAEETAMAWLSEGANAAMNRFNH
jgi:peptidyl-tRNA hydrolase, PTH1 family